MPGVYIGITHNAVGKVVDLRDHDSPNKPSLANMMSKDCSELINLWKSALEKQLEEMQEKDDSYHCGNSTKVKFVNVLVNELKHAKGLNAVKLQAAADKQEKKKNSSKKKRKK